MPLVEGAMVDYHTKKKISHSGNRISPETSRGCYYDLIPTPKKTIEECKMPIIQ
jgi:hypothetical protein